jgi:hypothetical protein
MGWWMQKAKLGLLIGVTVVVAVALVLSVVLQSPSTVIDTWSVDFSDGSMFISDAGASHGGFEFTATYWANISGFSRESIIAGDEIVLSLQLRVGLGDPLEKHEYLLRLGYDHLQDTVWIRNSSTNISLIRVDNDTIWNHEFDGYYITSRGGYAPSDEIRGNISPTIFGLPDHYYVELRLKLTLGHIVS